MTLNWSRQFKALHIFHLAFLCPLLSSTLYSQTLVDQAARGFIYSEPLVWVGASPPKDAETAVLLADLELTAVGLAADDFSALEDFIANFPNSPWIPSLRCQLARAYHERGRDTLALAHWEEVLTATIDIPSGLGKHIADDALARWTRLLASLGRYDMLVAVFTQYQSRVLDQGPLSQRWARTREAVAQMRLYPSESFACGSFALRNTARALNIKYDRHSLALIPSPATGFSLRDLADMSSKFGLGLVPVLRENGLAIPVPAVVHWQQDHYAAIVAFDGARYEVVDPTFGRTARWMTADTLNAEASGAFMVAASQLPPGFRLLSPAESALIYGRGNPNFFTDDDDQDCNGNQVAGTPACSGCAGVGMPVWRISQPYVNLWLHDTPGTYHPALGSAVAFQLTYKQRSESQLCGAWPGMGTVGNNWNCSWVSVVQGSPYGINGIAHIYYGSGGYSDYSYHYTDVATNYYNQLKLHLTTNSLGAPISYELLYPSGAKDLYGYLLEGSSSFLLSQRVSASGAALNFYYDNSGSGPHLVLAVDADGHTNSLSYGTHAYDADLITQVADPYGRTVSLSYNSDGLLTNLTDVASITSSFAYDANGWLTNLTTPYGATSFAPSDSGIASSIFDRNCAVTEPNASRQYCGYMVTSGLEPATYSSSEVPTNTPFGTLDTSTLYRFTYQWDRLQASGLSTTDMNAFTLNDLARAHMRHWLGGDDHLITSKADTLSVERTPSADGVTLGQKTFYDYPGKTVSDDHGDTIYPSVIAQVLPDGSTWQTYVRRNQWLLPTNVVTSYTKTDGTIGTRTNTFIYAANGLDLVAQIGPLGELVVSNYFSNTYHQPDASYDALNQQTRYTYNANRLLTSVSRPSGLTTTNIYFTSGTDLNRLATTIDLEISRTNSYTYANGMVFTHTDERGLKVTNYWDNLLRPTGVAYPDGSSSSNRYVNLDLTAAKDRLGHWSYSSYNAVRQKVAETNVNGVITRYGYCDCGALLTLTNAWGTSIQFVTSYAYDNQGSRTYTFLPDATLTNWFDLMGRVILAGDGWGVRYRAYNNQGLLSTVSNIFGLERVTVFDVEDRPLYVTDANAVTITNTFDKLGRVLTRGYPDGGIEKFGYSARGLTAYTNQLSLTNFYAYDAAGRKTFETNANAEVIRYTNNAAGDLLSLTDGKNQTTKWKYDEYGRVTNKTDQAGTEILRYKYDPNSRLTNRWSAAKGNTYYSFDYLGNLTNIDYPASTDVRFKYDGLNRLTNMVDAAGTTAYTYASGGQLWTEDGPFSNDTVTNTYSGRLRTKLTLQQPSGLWTNVFSYDAAGRLTNVLSPAGSFTYTLGASGPGGMLVKKLLLPNTSYITNTYGSVARLTGTYLKNSSQTVLDSMAYGYNTASQRATSTNAANASVNYIYDRIGQLTVADSVTNSEDRGYFYDTAWNLNRRTNNGITFTFAVDNKNQLTSDPGSASDLYDGSGNLTNRSTTVNYTYDDENRLVSFIQNTVARSDFIYDGLGRLRQRIEYSWVGSWNPTSTNYYIYDGNRVVQERTTSPTVSYTRGLDLSGTLEGAGGIGGLLARSHGYSSGNWTNHNFYHADGNGNITYLVNSSQTLAASYRYDPFGNTIASSGTLASANVYRFSSKEIHVNSGMYCYLYRFYDPSLQRWLNRDPLGEFMDANLYRFVRNGPLGHLDVWGLQGITPPAFPPVGFIPGNGGALGPTTINPGAMGPAWEYWNYEPGHLELPESGEEGRSRCRFGCPADQCPNHIVAPQPAPAPKPPPPPQTPPEIGCSLCPINIVPPITISTPPPPIKITLPLPNLG